jgi:integrase
VDTTTTRLTSKPAKPHPDFPLYAHATRRWAKKVHGKTHFFGPWEEPDKALALWLDQKDDLLADRKPRTAAGSGPSVRDIVNRFMSDKAVSRKAGKLADRTFVDYYETCERIVKQFGERRPVADLRPDDFTAMFGAMSETRGPVTLGNEVQRVRTVFKHAFDNDVIPAPVKFGTVFKKPSKKESRIHKATKPRKLFAADEIRALLKAADAEMQAMILLGINCGWGNKDVAGVRESHFDLKAGVAVYSRAKTGVDRRATLWPETVKAIKKALETRPKALVEADADLLFITRWGNPWRVSAASVDMDADRKVRRSETDSVGLEFGKLLRKVKVKRAGKPVVVKREGVNFYTLRHTFKTIAEGAGDIPAVDRVMGHEDTADIGHHYREWAADASEDVRLRKVTDHVRAWLYAKVSA